MLMLKTYVRQLILPPAGPLLLAILGILLQRYRPRLGRTVVLACIAALWLLSLPVVSDSLRSLTEHYGPLDVSQQTGAQAIVILGGGGQTARAPEYGGPVATSITLEKITYGAYVARKTGLPILVTGNGIETIAMRETLARNFDTAVHWDEEQARDTFENAANSARLLLPEGIRKIILITRSTHMWRSVQEFQAVGFEVLPAPVGLPASAAQDTVEQYVPDASKLLESSLAIYELLGEPVRRFMEFTHLRRHPPPPTAPGAKAFRSEARTAYATPLTSPALLLSFRDRNRDMPGLA